MVQKSIRLLNQRLLPGRLFHPPSWIVLGVNNICNLHCRMCDVGTGYQSSSFYANLAGSRPLNMPEQTIRRIIDQTAQHFPSAKLGYAFTEPLVYPHLLESLEYAGRRGLHTSITTNALKLPQRAAGLVEAGLNDLFVSLDGPLEIHNSIRGHRHSFQNATRGIDILLGMERSPGISIYCVITEWNIGHLVEFADCFRDLPLTELGFMHANFTPERLAGEHNKRYGDRYPATASNISGFRVENINLEELWREIGEFGGNDYPFPVRFSPTLTTRAELDRYYREPDHPIGTRCHDIFRNLMVKSDGTVIPAHGRCYNLTVGDINRTDLKTIWNSATLARFRTTVSRAGGLLPACSRCCSAFG